MHQNQGGIAQIVIILILLAGLAGGLYLVRNTTVFQPKADEPPITIDDSRIRVTHSPNPIRADNEDVTFVISASEPILPTGKYIFKVTSLNDPNCLQSGYIESKDPNNIIVISSVQLEVPLAVGIKPLTGCKVVPGKRKFELWYGEYLPSASKIVLDYSFEVEQAGGGRAPEITPLNENLGISETPEVQIRNARPGIIYTLWWDGSLLKALNYTTSYAGTTDKIAVPKNGVDFTQAGQKTLCMTVVEDETFMTVARLSCNYKAVFTFSLLPPVSSNEPACSIVPTNPTPSDSVTIKAINLPKNQDFRADLIIQDTTIHMPLQQNSKDSGIVSLHLASSFGPGNYAAQVFNTTSNEYICQEDFEVKP